MNRNICKTQKISTVLLFVLVIQSFGVVIHQNFSATQISKENSKDLINSAQSSQFDYTIYPEFYDGTAMDFCFAGDVAFLADGYGGIEMFIISDLHTFSKIGEWDPGTNIHGAVVVNNILAVISENQDIILLSISDVPNLVEISRFHNDEYLHDLQCFDNFVFFETGFNSNIKILNISNPANPQLLNDTENFWSSIEFGDYHISNNKLFLTTSYTPTFQIYNISNINQPQLLYNYSLSEEDYVYIRYFEVLNDVVLLQFSDNMPIVFNITDLNSINIIPQPNLDYCISRINTNGEILVCIGTSATSGYVPTISFFELSSDLIFREIMGSEYQGDYPYKIQFHENFLYFTRLENGFSIYNISNYQIFQEIVSFDEDAYIYEVIADGEYVYALTDLGLEIFDFSNPNEPKKLGEYWFSPRQHKFFKNNNYIYVFVRKLGILIIDVSLPSKPTEIDQIKLSAFDFEFEMNNQNMYVFYHDEQNFDVQMLIIYEILEDGKLGEIYNERVWYDMRSICLCNDQIYYYTWDHELWKMDVGNPQKIKNQSLISFSDDFYYAEIKAVPSRDALYVGLNSKEIHLYSNRLSNSLKKVDALVHDGYSTFLPYNLYVFVATADGLAVYDAISEERFILLTKIREVSYYIQSMEISSSGAMVIAEYSDGIQWISLPDLEIAPEVTPRSSQNFNIPGYNSFLLGIVSIISVYLILNRRR